MSEKYGDLSSQSQFTQFSTSGPDERKGKSYTMQGVRVNFPYVAYPSQVAMMDKIIRSLRNKHNCLLESPTGSGKSAALLCATLAWQRKELENILALEQAAEEADRALTEHQKANESKPACPKSGNNGGVSMPQASQSTWQTIPCSTPKPVSPSVSQNFKGNDDDNDFQPQKRFRRSNLPQPQNSPAQDVVQHIIIQVPPQPPGAPPLVLNLEEVLRAIKASPKVVTPSSEPTGHSDLEPKIPVVQSQVEAIQSTQAGTPQPTQKCKSSKQATRPRMHRPKIFFCTRTHKQVKQITQELNSTAYREAKMCILSSREQTCIHPTVSKQANKNEGCKDLLKNPGGIQCSLYHNARGLNQHTIKDLGLDSAWDLENIVALGKQIHFCPYFGVRELMQDADIIFCPYNYVTDPLIRTSMNITLKGNVVILDEGHNIEDFAREAASFSVNQDELDEAIKDLEVMPCDETRLFAGILSRMSSWIDRNSKNMNDYSQFDRTGKVMSGQDIVAMMTDFGAGPANLHGLIKQLEAISVSDEHKNVFVSSSALRMIEGLLFTLDYLYRNELKFMSDYRCVLVKTFVLKRHDDSSSGWRQKTLTPRPSNTYTLNFWCLNPGVCFSDFHSVHSLIVTSGTLSPIVSFESELALKFPIAFEANHVIKRNQVWVGSIGCGPNNIPLKAVYQNTESLQFQDELGQVVLQVCQTVPHGVLCFFPSYSNLEKMVTRWQLTGLMEKLESTKLVVTEPRANNKARFGDMLQDFYSAIEEGEGAIFFAVYRGKVSEGLNFADDNARAVIAIGIPYPNVKDIQVDLKQKYNNEHFRNRSLMSGRDWYEAQAFRALNQALGRCIRHKGDWGALILVDQRFQANAKYGKSLSKWVRNELFHYSSFLEAMDSLKFFTKSAQKINNELNSSAQFVLQSTPTAKPSCLESSNVDSGFESVLLSSTSTSKPSCLKSSNVDCGLESTLLSKASGFQDSHSNVESSHDIIELGSSPELF